MTANIMSSLTTQVVVANSSAFPGAKNSSSTTRETVRATTIPTAIALACLSHTFSLIVLRVDDSVLIRNCPPVSARKRFTLEKVVRSPETERDLTLAAAVETLALSPSPTPTL